MADSEKLVCIIFIFGSLKLCMSDQSWTRCARSTSHWTVDRKPVLVIQTRNALECIYSCVRSVECGAVQYDGLSLSCRHFYRGSFLRVKNGTAHESVAFVRDMPVLVAQTQPRYTYTLEKAKAACKAIGLSLMTDQQLRDRLQAGFSMCHCAWISEGRRVLPMSEPRPECGGGNTGLVSCDYFTTADAWCTFT